MEYIVLFINMQKYMKDYDKNKESSYLKDWDINNLHGWAQSQKLPVNCFKCVGDAPQFNEDFIESCNEESDEGCFLEFGIQYPENNVIFTMIYHFCLKE